MNQKDVQDLATRASGPQTAAAKQLAADIAAKQVITTHARTHAGQYKPKTLQPDGTTAPPAEEGTLGEAGS